MTALRARFEELCSDVFAKTMTPVEKVLQDSKMSKGYGRDHFDGW